MNKKLVLAAALVFGAAGLILAQGTVKAQDVNASVNSTESTTTTPTTNDEGTTTTTTDNSSVNAENAVAPEAPAAKAAY